MSVLTRRELLTALAAAPFLGQARPSPHPALTMARFLNALRYADLPPIVVDRSRILIASTLASAASGSLIGSARIVRDLAKEQGGTSEASIWFAGAKLPLGAAARVNAMQSDASASDDSDLRNAAHTGTTLVSTGLAIAELTGATGQDVLTAIAAGYEAAGRFGAARGMPRSRP
jgi:2-methylcitrate dehydratase PrpD